MCVAEDVFELLNSFDKELKLNILVEILKQSALEKADEPQPGCEDSTMN